MSFLFESALTKVGEGSSALVQIICDGSLSGLEKHLLCLLSIDPIVGLPFVLFFNRSSNLLSELLLAVCFQVQHSHNIIRV